MNRFLCAAVLSALAIETLGASIRHHAHHHAKKDLSDVDWNNPDLYKDVDWAHVFGNKDDDATPQTAAPAAAPAVSQQAAPAASSPKASPSQASSSNDDSSSDSSSSSPVSGLSTAFGGVTAAIANGNVDEYIGNVGIPYGSNIIKVSDSDAESFQYTNKFENHGSASCNVIVWNKSGPDGRANSGQYSTPALTFELAPGAHQYVAFDKNSQVAFCNDSGKRTQWGGKDCTFGEADFGNESNGGWSGYDVSSIQNTAGNSEALTISSPMGETSSNRGNNYVSDKQLGGIGGNLAPGHVRLSTVFG